MTDILGEWDNVSHGRDDRTETLESVFRRKPRRWLMMTDATEEIAALRAAGMAILERGEGDVKFYRFEPGMRAQTEPLNSTDNDLPW